jgi:S1-C subfamily serine protease
VRNGREREASVVLKGEEASRPSEGAAQNLQDIYERLGASFAPLSEGLKQRYDTDAGVVVSEVRPGGFFDQLGIPRGMVIVQVNGRAVYTPEDINEALMAARNGRVQILGIAPDGSRVAFVFSLGT